MPQYCTTSAATRSPRCRRWPSASGRLLLLRFIDTQCLLYNGATAVAAPTNRFEKVRN